MNMLEHIEITRKEEPSYDDLIDHGAWIYEHKETHMFYFADEIGDLHGPYFGKDIAQEEIELYCYWLDRGCSREEAIAERDAARGR